MEAPARLFTDAFGGIFQESGSPVPGLALGAAFALAAVALGLVRGARLRSLAGTGERGSWLLTLDRSTPDTQLRKRQERPVPAVGGTVILAAVGLGWLVGGQTVSLPAAAALGLAWFVGFVDDRRRAGLSPRAKLLGQMLATLPVAWALAESRTGAAAGAGAFLGALVAGVAAMNLWNTFDNSDGAAGGLALLAAPFAPLLAAPLAVFLVFNTDGRQREGPGRAAPTAYLGDSGSHLLGMALLLVPAAWPLFLLPALDLARLCGVRVRAGRRPWQGDRRHLAHRLQQRGLGTYGVLAVLAAVALPALVLRGALGAGLTLLLYGAAVLWTSPRAAAELPAGVQ